MSEPKSDRITEARLAEISKDWYEDSVHRRTGSVSELLAELRRLRGLIVDAHTPDPDLHSRFLALNALRDEAEAIRNEAKP